jgi:hypothetical protein
LNFFTCIHPPTHTHCNTYPLQLCFPRRDGLSIVAEVTLASSLAGSSWGRTASLLPPCTDPSSSWLRSLGHRLRHPSNLGRNRRRGPKRTPSLPRKGFVSAPPPPSLGEFESKARAHVARLGLTGWASRRATTEEPG